MRRPALAAIALIALSIPAGAGGGTEEPASGDEAWTLERFQWAEEIGSATRLELTNGYGDLRTRDAGDSRVEVVANLQEHRDDRRRPEVVIERFESSLRLTVVYRAPEAAQPDTSQATSLRGRVDVSVLVPAGVDVTARTTRGLLELKGIEGAVDGGSTSGDIVLSTAGSAHLKTESGSIKALFKSTDWPWPAELQTVDGEIAVWLPPSAGVTVSGETGGQITTDFTLEIEQLDDGGRKRATARIGDGKAKLQLDSVRGPLKILRSH